MNKDWVKIYSSTALYEVEVLKSRLEEAEIPAVIMNKQDSAYLNFGRVELYVPEESAKQAVEIIQ